MQKEHIDAEDYKMIEKLREHGWAVAAFSPEEVGQKNANHLEEIMVERGTIFLEE